VQDIASCSYSTLPHDIQNIFLKNQREVCTVKASSIIWAEPYLITAFCYYRPGLFYRDVCYYLINFQPLLSLPISLSVSPIIKQRIWPCAKSASKLSELLCDDSSMYSVFLP